MLHAAESGGRKSDRHGHVLADHRGPNRPILDVHGHTLPKANRCKIAFVGSVRALGPGTRVHIVIEHPGHASACQKTEVFNASYERHCNCLSRCPASYARPALITETLPN